MFLPDPVSDFGRTPALTGARTPRVRILVVGAGGVGSAFAAIAQRRSFFEMLAAYGSPHGVLEL